MARLVAAVLWAGAAWLSLGTTILLNDHFARISAARQIAVYGELPFRDFFDPGYFLTIFSSAALQRLFGDNLLGEVLMTSAFIATGTLIVFALVRRLTGSIVAGVVTATLALLLLPRAYDFDKVLFYPLGLWLCWRYVDRPTARSLVWLASGLLVAALYRYDTGVYIGAAAAVTLAVVHAGQWRVFGRRLALLTVAVAGLSLPALGFLQFDGGLPGAFDQVWTYGRREEARTHVTTPPAFAVRLPRSGSGDAGGDRNTPPDDARRANGDAFLYYLFRALPLVSVGVLMFGLRSPGAVSRSDAARLAGVVTMAMLLNAFILRDPVGARFGGMAGPAAVLAGWLAYGTSRARTAIARRTLILAAACVVALAVWSESASSDWPARIPFEALRPRRVVSMLGALAESPPRLDLFVDRQFAQLVRYVRECTGPQDRILATWFVPELFFYSQRGFAAGISTMFGDHWSEERFQSRSVEILSSQRVPIVVSRAGDEDYRYSYPQLARYLDEHYRDAGTTSFGMSEVGPGYTVLVRSDRTPSYIHQVSSWPCFR